MKQSFSRLALPLFISLVRNPLRFIDLSRVPQRFERIGSPGEGLQGFAMMLVGLEIGMVSHTLYISRELGATSHFNTQPLEGHTKGNPQYSQGQI